MRGDGVTAQGHTALSIEHWDQRTPRSGCIVRVSFPAVPHPLGVSCAVQSVEYADLQNQAGAPGNGLMPGHMKRVLLISYFFPPQPSPGALRPGYLARYLPEFGWQATVLTHSPEKAPFPVELVNASTAHSFIERWPFRVRNALLFPDATAAWIPAAFAAGERALSEHQFDAILGTGLPSTVHVAGARLAQRSGLPWIADYRDLWSGNPYVKRNALRASIETSFERRLLCRASAITTISEPIAAQLRRLHRRDDVYVIPNAYDSSDWETVPAAEPARFDLSFTGTMHGGKRTPDLLFAALAQLRAERQPAGNEARVHFYGPNNQNVAASALKYGVNLLVRQHGVVPRAEAMRAQRSSAVLLIFLSMEPSTATEMGSKYLEYIGARRPIIAFGPKDSVMRSFIERSGAGWFASDVEEAKFSLRAAYGRFITGTFDVHADLACAPSARELARRFAAILEGAAPNSSLKSIA